MTTPSSVLVSTSGADGELYDLAATGGVGPRVQAMLASALVIRSSPVFIEDYLVANGNDIRRATIAALGANPTAGEFWFPPGAWQFVGNPITKANGFRNGIRFHGQGTQLFRDMAGADTAAIIFFFRGEEDEQHGDRIVFEGIRFSLLNVHTSFFSQAVEIVAASNCAIINCEADCTLIGGETAGRIRWGFALLGADRSTAPTGGFNNLFHDITLRLAQLQGCGQPRSADNIIFSNIFCQQANDLCLSCVTTDGGSIRNCVVDTVTIEDSAGSGGMLLGNDGTAPGHGCVLIENFVINNVVFTGQRNPDLLFQFVGSILFNGGLTTRNVCMSNIGTRLVPNATVQARSIIIASQDAEISWEGLSLTNCELDVVTSNDPLEPLFIQGTNMTGVSLTNVRCKGRRGIAIRNADALTIINCSTDDGQLTIRADLRSIDSVMVCNSRLKSTTGFNSSLVFASNSGKNFTNVELSNLVLDSNIAGLLTALNGGTMAMMLANVANVSGNNPTAETLAGIIRAVNTPGLPVLTTVSVVVPAVAAASVGYVDVSMAGTRLSTLAVGEGVVANPTADLVAAGVGGGFIGARVSAAGVVRCAFLGALAGGAVNFTFSRTAA
jgi:hypothetical protein